MSYSPHTDQTRAQMLRTIGVERFDDLLGALPQEIRQKQALNLPPGLPEAEADSLLEALAGANAVPPDYLSFLGGGSYDHHVPAVVDNLSSRSEFFTAYTPYQPEVSQGTLQATWEFQSLIRRLTAMEVAQASLYDGASAVAEAALLAMAHTKRRGIVLAGELNPRYRRVLDTYLTAHPVTVRTATGADGCADFDCLSGLVDDQTACVIMPSPNYFGGLDDWKRAAGIAHENGALFVAVFHPLSLGLLVPPGECGADVAVGEGQALGNPVAFGGPLLGLMATRRSFVRRLPGRLVGRSVDARGVPAFVMTLQTREQHIRREKATSNICTAQALLATRAAIYMALLGKAGMVRLAATCAERAHYLAARVAALDGFAVPFGSSFFNEFVVESEYDASRVLDLLRAQRILGGIELGGRFPDFGRRFLVCVTEKHTAAMLDRFAGALAEIKRQLDRQRPRLRGVAHHDQAPAGNSREPR